MQAAIGLGAGGSGWDDPPNAAPAESVDFALPQPKRRKAQSADVALPQPAMGEPKSQKKVRAGKSEVKHSKVGAVLAKQGVVAEERSCKGEQRKKGKTEKEAPKRKKGGATGLNGEEKEMLANKKQKASAVSAERAEKRWHRKI